MTIAAGEVVSGEARVPVGRVRSEKGIGHQNEVAAVPHEPTMRVVRQCVNVWDGPDLVFLALLLTFLKCGGANGDKRAEPRQGRETDADDGHLNCYLPDRTA